MANEQVVKYEGHGVQQVLKQGTERASIQTFLEATCPGIVFDGTKSIMPQLRAWVERQHPEWSRSQIKAEAERKMRKEFRPYTDALVAHITREYDLELPKFNKPTKTGLVNGGSIPFKRKTSVAISKAELKAKLDSGDPALADALARAGYDLAVEATEVREVESNL